MNVRKALRVEAQVERGGSRGSVLEGLCAFYKVVCIAKGWQEREEEEKGTNAV